MLMVCRKKLRRGAAGTLAAVLAAMTALPLSSDDGWLRAQEAFASDLEVSVTLASDTVDIDAGVSAAVDCETDDQQVTNIYDLEGECGVNISKNDYIVRGSTVKSYIIENEDNTLTTLEYIVSSGVIVLDTYAQDYTLLDETTLDMELSLFGGFYCGEQYNYLVFGQENTEESDECEVLRVVKYSKNWERVGAASVYGANTYAPFASGSLRMCETNGSLYIHTSHQMYQSSDGYHHQANMTYVVDEENMDIEQSYYNIMNISVGYVSHSFNQYIQTDGTYVYRVDHGDAYPRSVVLTRCDVNGKITSVSCVNVLKILGDTGENSTGVSVGGLELSQDQCLIVGNSVDQSDSDTYSATGVRNAFLSVVSKDLSMVRTIWLTDYTDEDETTVRTPQLVKISDNLFVLMWEEYDDNTGGIITKIMTVDGSGNTVSEAKAAPFRLSNCKPIVTEDGAVKWFTSDGEKVLYTFDPNDLTFQKIPQTIIAGTTYQKTFGDSDFKPLATNQGDGELTYQSSDTNVFSVDETGTVTIVGAGEATLTVTAAQTELYLETKVEIPIIIGSKSLTYSGSSIDVGGPYAYTGEEIIPDIEVSLGDVVLEKDVDYVVTATRNTNVGSYAYYTVTGIGNYKGSLTGYFTIEKAEPVFTGTTTYEKAYNDEKFTLDLESSIGAPLYYESDNPDVASVSGDGVVTVHEIGTAHITVDTMYETYNYLRGVADVTVNVSARSVEDEAVSCEVEGTYIYNGKEIQPSLTVTCGETVLEEDVDYTLDYSDNIHAGTNAKIIVTGIGNYKDSKEIFFTIEKAEQTIYGDTSYCWKNGDEPFRLNNSTDGGEKLTYQSSNPEVVTVSEDGLVEITGAGTAVITVTVPGKNDYSEAVQKIQITIENVGAGDLNGDDLITLEDVVAIKRYIAGWNIFIYTYAADMDGDGDVTLKDLALLKRVAAGWDITI